MNVHENMTVKEAVAKLRRLSVAFKSEELGVIANVIGDFIDQKSYHSAASLLGKKGGAAKTKRKSDAVRKNMEKARQAKAAKGES